MKKGGNERIFSPKVVSKPSLTAKNDPDSFVFLAWSAPYRRIHLTGASLCLRPASLAMDPPDHLKLDVAQHSWNLQLFNQFYFCMLLILAFINNKFSLVRILIGTLRIFIRLQRNWNVLKICEVFVTVFKNELNLRLNSISLAVFIKILRRFRISTIVSITTTYTFETSFARTFESVIKKNVL